MDKPPKDVADAYLFADAFLRNAGIVTDSVTLQREATEALHKERRNAFVAGWYAHQRYMNGQRYPVRLPAPHTDAVQK